MSITNQIVEGGMFAASIRDYDALLMDKPPYSPPYIHKAGLSVADEVRLYNPLPQRHTKSKPKRSAHHAKIHSH